MGIQNTSFMAYASASLGTNNVQVKATDYSNNSRTNTYQLVVTNNGLAKTLSYDANGNLTNVATTTYTNKYEWDGADRLMAIEMRPAGSVFSRSDFSYDGLGRRTRVIESTNGVQESEKWFVWCAAELCEQRDYIGSSTERRFFGQGEQIFGTNYFFARDHLGSIREITDTNNAVRARYEYDPYGQRTKVSGDVDAAFAFTGHYYHGPSGLHLAVFRAYDAGTARWLSRDLIEESGGLNVYCYVYNDPIGAIDPDGRFAIVPILIIAGGALLIVSISYGLVAKAKGDTSRIVGAVYRERSLDVEQALRSRAPEDDPVEARKKQCEAAIDAAINYLEASENIPGHIGNGVPLPGVPPNFGGRLRPPPKNVPEDVVEAVGAGRDLVIEAIGVISPGRPAVPEQPGPNKQKR
jgi:RHS repeat-associated protein